MEVVLIQLHPVKVFALPLGHESVGLPMREPRSAPVQILSATREGSYRQSTGAKQKGMARKARNLLG